MGADTKRLRTRIKSVKSTLHLTRAMGLVASSKMRKSSEDMNNSNKYEKAVRDAIEPILSSSEAKKNAYMRQSSGNKICLVVIAGDRGLAGGYNANIFRALREYKDADIIPIGKKACERFEGELYLAESFDYLAASKIATKLCDDFLSVKYDRIAILCTRYISMLSQEAYFKDIFPLVAKEKANNQEVIFEPDEMTVFNSMIPSYVSALILSAVRESFASEVSARRCAMDSAGKNAEEMINNLHLEYNRARQSAITQEITEIVAGSGSN